jgi:cytochrome c-type biogenesis protein CcmH/NrfG
MAGVRQVTPDQLKLMADKQAQPLLSQLQSTPNDPELLSKLGHIYYVTQNFKEASTYFKRSVDIRDDAIVRTELGRAYYYAGDPDDALAEFDHVLKSDPDNANAMFNVGMIKWQSKSDADGAVAAWQQILKKYPNHPRRAEVEQLIARAKQHRTLK